MVRIESRQAVQGFIEREEIGARFGRDYQSFVDQANRDQQALKAVELKCDAVAMLTLRAMGYDPTLFVEGVQQVEDLIVKHGYCLNPFGTHPSILERRQFTRRFLKLLR